MLKVILFSLFLTFTKNQESKQPVSDGNGTMHMLLNDTNASSMKLFEHGSDSRKLLDSETSAPTLEPSLTSDSVLYKSPIYGPSPALNPTYSKLEWDLIWGSIGVGGVLSLACIFCGVKYVYRKCQDKQAYDIAYPLEISNKADTNKLNITV